MDVPRFTRNELNAHLVAGDLHETFSRVVREAKGKLHEVREATEVWLSQENNRLLPEASRVYCAWLDVTGNAGLIEKPLAEWLAVNGGTKESERVFRVWLEVGGRFAFVRKEVFEWVRTHTLERDAGYLLKHVVRQRVLPDDVALKILNWCAEFAHDRDAIWRMSSLSAHVSADLFLDALRVAVPVLAPSFANPSLLPVTRSQVTTVLGNLTTLEHLASHPQSPELDALLCRWMNHPQSFEASPDHGRHHQTRHFLLRLIAAAESAVNTPELTPLIDWAGSWEERVRLNCKDLIKRARILRHKSTAGRPRRPATPPP